MYYRDITNERVINMNMEQKFIALLSGQIPPLSKVLEEMKTKGGTLKLIRMGYLGYAVYYYKDGKTDLVLDGFETKHDALVFMQEECL